MLKSTVLLGALTLLASADAPVPDIREWAVPWDASRPRDPFVDPKGRVWFVGQEGNYVAYLDPATGRFERYEVDAGTHPHNLVVDTTGMIWFTGNRNGRLVRLDPASRKLTTYPIPDGEIGDPHTMIFDRAGNAWFTAQQAGAVGRFEAATGTFRFWRTGAGTRPYGIVADGGGRIWFDLFGTNELGAIDPKSLAMKRYPLPDGARPRRIGVTSDGMVWYGDYARGYLGRLDPATGAVREYALPGGGRSLPLQWRWTIVIGSGWPRPGCSRTGWWRSIRGGGVSPIRWIRKVATRPTPSAIWCTMRPPGRSGSAPTAIRSDD